MSSIFFNNVKYKKEIIFFFFLYISLIASFFFGENSTGGAIVDYFNQKFIVQKFSSGFLNTLYTYDSNSTRHSPILLIFLSFFEKINLPDYLIRLIHLHLCLLLPIFFYKCLIIKFNKIDIKIILLLSALIFLSPTFRTLSIWPDSRLLGLTLFTISVYFFLRFEENKKFLFAFLNIIFLAFGAYVSPNFSVFSILFIIKFFSYYGVFSKKTLFLILTNLFLALPALYYVFILDVKFFLQTAAIGLKSSESMFFYNISNDILITFSIIFFYIFPFVYLKVIKLENFFSIKNFFISILIFSICLFSFDYNYSYTGGGIFFKLSNFIFNNNYLFYLISFVAVLVVCAIAQKNYLNILLITLIILNNPQYTIYHKYFDPFLLIIFFTIFSLNINIKRINDGKNYLFIFSYFLGFLILSNLKLILLS